MAWLSSPNNSFIAFCVSQNVSYSKRPNMIIGFYGCDKESADSIIKGETFMNKSANDYDWLGHGIVSTRTTTS